MNATVVQPELNLRVAIVAPDAARAANLRSIVERAGHVLTTADDAEVVLVELPLEQLAEIIPGGKPVLILGSRDVSRAGWLPRDATEAQIDVALRAIAVGLSVRPSSEVEDIDVVESAGSAERGFEELRERSPHALLTPRELEVLARVSAGSSNKTIARELGISLHTVKFHLESLFRKLGVRTRAEAVAKALERRGRDTIEI